jgi:peptidoglycan/LPS O-acetylase OafA/YrhL
MMVLLLLKINLIYLSPLLAYLLIQLAYIKGSFVNFGKFGDFSYGIYIYAFPIQQLVINMTTKYFVQPFEWWMLFLATFPLTLLCAIASWHLIEKKFSL